MFCSKCGKEIEENSSFCSHCGNRVGQVNAVNTSVMEDEPNVGLNLLSFFFPLIGLILYIVYHESRPKKARGVGQFAVVGLIMSIALWAVIAEMGSSFYM